MKISGGTTYWRILLSYTSPPQTRYLKISEDIWGFYVCQWPLFTRVLRVKTSVKYHSQTTRLSNTPSKQGIFIAMTIFMRVTTWIEHRTYFTWFLCCHFGWLNCCSCLKVKNRGPINPNIGSYQWDIDLIEVWYYTNFLA